MLYGSIYVKCPETVRSIEMESRLVIARICGKEDRGVTDNGYGVAWNENIL